MTIRRNGNATELFCGLRTKTPFWNIRWNQQRDELVRENLEKLTDAEKNGLKTESEENYMPAYSKAYLDEVVEEQGNLFENVKNYIPGIDVQDFIQTYMTSKTRKYVDQNQPYVCTMNARELFEYFLKVDHFEPKQGSGIGGFLPNWVGQFYAYYQWLYDLPSTLVLEEVPLRDLIRSYPGLHDLDLELAVKKVGDSIHGTDDYRK